MCVGWLLPGNHPIGLEKEVHTVSGSSVFTSTCFLEEF